MGRRFAPLELDEVERAELTSLASRRSTAQGLALRARIILACAEGEQSKVLAARLDIDADTVGKWRRRFAEHRLEGLWDEPRSGTPRTIEDDVDKEPREERSCGRSQTSLYNRTRRHSAIGYISPIEMELKAA